MILILSECIDFYYHQIEFEVNQSKTKKKDETFSLKVKLLLKKFLSPHNHIFYTREMSEESIYIRF
jgi:hypothetical protein